MRYGYAQERVKADTKIENGRKRDRRDKVKETEIRRENWQRWGQCILLSVVFTSSPSSRHGSVWLLHSKKRLAVFPYILGQEEFGK